MENSLIRLKDVSKFYYNKGVIASGFSKVSLEFKMGEFVAITGESGSGKSTLLNVISGLDTYEEGEMYIDGKETSHFSEKDFENYRRKNIANIYQTFNLINSYTVFQNIELVLMLNGTKRRELKKKAFDLIKKVDLYKFRNTKVSKLSGGQKQRVAIARALAKETPIIIADEPTGNLDVASAEEVVKLLREIAKERLVIIVTHNYEQVEKYVTRKIKMHDGKVLEDKQISETKEAALPPQKKQKNISFGNLIRLGVRNTFNVVPKFVLLLIVFAFLTIAILAEYASYEKNNYLNSISGYNWVFNNASNNRVVIKKADSQPISDEELAAISALENVDSVVKNDLPLDNMVFLNDENYNYWLNGSAVGIDTLQGEPDAGRLPENANEIVVGLSKDNYFIQGSAEEMVGLTLYGENDMGEIDLTKPYYIAGVKYIEDSPMLSDKYGSMLFFVSNDYLNNYNFELNRQYSRLRVLFDEKYYDSDQYSPQFMIIPNANVDPGCVVVSYNLNETVERGYVRGLPLSITNKSLYYETGLDLEIVDTYSKWNIENKLGIPYDEEKEGAIYINPDQYNSLFATGTFQSSIFVKDFSDEALQPLKDYLDANGFKYLALTDALYVDDMAIMSNIFYTFMTIVLFIVLFFITYFVIRLIMKSRNVYYTTFRMLGGKKSSIRFIIILELVVVASIAYGAFMVFLYLNYAGYFVVPFVDNMLNYLTILDYVILYLIFLGMAILIGNKYASKLFKGSAMKAFRDEV